MTAQEALNAHPLAKKAYVNAKGEWHFSTPPSDFVVVEVLEKGKQKPEPTADEETQTSKKNGRKKDI